MAEPVVIALISSLLGGFLVAITNQLFTREKTKAEAQKLRAEADKARVEATKLLKELDIKPTSKTIDNRIPYGWTFSGSSADYEAGIDRHNVHSGHASGYLKSRRVPTEFSTLMQTFKAYKYRSKRVRMLGYAKAENVLNWAGLWMRVDGQNKETLSFDNMYRRPIQGTTDWRKHEIVVDVPANSENIALGIILMGEGQVWIDDIQLETVDNDIPTTNLQQAIPEEPVNLNFEIMR